MRTVLVLLFFGFFPVFAQQSLKLDPKEQDALNEEAMGRYGKAWRLYLDAFRAAVKRGDEASIAVAEVYLHRAKSLFEQQARPDFSILAKHLSELKEEVKNPILGAYLRFYLAEAFLSCGRWQDAHAEMANLGFVRDWFVIGPFDNERGTGFSEVYGPEKELKFDAEYRGKRREVKWRAFTITSPLPILNFNAIMRPNDQVLAYALCLVHSEKDQTVALRFGSDEGFKLFVNTKEVLVHDCHRDFFWDQEVVTVLLRKGWNAVLFKVAEDKGEWQLALRITALDGAPVKGVKFAKTLEEAKEAVRGLSSFKAAVGEASLGARGYFAKAEKRDDITALFHLAYLHFAYHWKDISLHKDREYLLRVFKSCPKNAIVAFWLSATYIASRAEMETEKTENKRKEYMLKALSLKPDYVEVLCNLGEYYLKRLNMWRRAEEYATRALSANPNYAPAKVLKLSIYKARKFRIEHEVELLRISKLNPPDTLLEEILEALERWGKVKRAEMVLENLWRRNMNHPGLLSRYVMFLREHKKDKKALSLLDSFLAAHPYNIEARKMKAEILSSQDRFEEAVKEYEAILAFCPEDRDVLLACGKLLLRLSLELGEDTNGPTYKRGLKLLRYVLRIDPTNAWVKRYLELLGAKRSLIEEMERFADTVSLKNDTYIIKDHSFVNGKVTVEKINIPVKEVEEKARRENAPYVCIFYRLLLEITERATSSEHHYIVLRVMNERGAENLKSLYCPRMTVGWGMEVKVKEAKIIRRDGTVEDVRVSRGFVTFQNLRVGDTVVLSFRADEHATEENKFFGDYYGQIILLNPTARIRRFFFSSSASDMMPVFFSKLTLLLPDKGVRPIHIHTKKITVKPTEEPGVDEKTRVLVWRLRNLPLLIREPYMPPITQITPNVQVSTFFNWKRFGKWFWNLIRKQFDSTRRLKEKVAELTKGCRSEMEKIYALARFAIEGIRYEEAASFNIHGWKPYKASQILERGNGDCKDKAILFVTMMREAGLRAYIALVRSQTEGRGHPDLTLPLIRHFNHAIAYVPPTKEHPELWLDLTADRYSLPEMPPEWVRGAVAFVVGEDMAELKTIPYTTVDITQKLEAEVNVSADGKASFRFKATLKGYGPWLLRKLMEEEGRRKERIENSLNERIANFRLLRLKLPDLKEPFKSPFVWEMEGEAIGFVSQTSEGPGVRPLPLSRRWCDELAGLQTRKTPLALPTTLSRAGVQPIPIITVPGTCLERWVYRFTAHKVKTLPKNLEIKNRYITATITFKKLSDKSFEVRRKVVFHANWVGIDGYNLFREALAKLDGHLSRFVLLEPEK